MLPVLWIVAAVLQFIKPDAGNPGGTFDFRWRRQDSNGAYGLVSSMPLLRPLVTPINVFTVFTTMSRSSERLQDLR